MKKSSHSPLVLCLYLMLWLSYGKLASSIGTNDGSEQWGYALVRPRAHMFWWLYRSPQRVDSPFRPWPIVLWLQGGPGASGVGMGNFQEIGPLDGDLKPRNSTWLQKADLLFVDNPVGTGFSFVEDESLLVKTDEEAATDLTTLLKKLFNRDKKLQASPLFIVAESYGGKYAATLGLSILKAIKNRELKLKLGGIAIGNSWISPEDFVFSWGPLLKDVSRLDDNGLERANSQAQIIKQQIDNGQYRDATDSWAKLEGVIRSNSNNVDFYNFMLDDGGDPISAADMGGSSGLSMKKYSRYLSSKASLNGDFGTFMDTVIRKKLKIIPKYVSWGGQSDAVFSALAGDFMKPRINEVDELLSSGANITIYSGQLDLICATIATEAWLKKLKWDGLESFNKLDRSPLYCNSISEDTRGFLKSYKNLQFYWILGSGHFVPAEQPCTAVQMIAEITQSPA